VTINLLLSCYIVYTARTGSCTQPCRVQGRVDGLLRTQPCTRPVKHGRVYGPSIAVYTIGTGRMSGNWTAERHAQVVSRGGCYLSGSPVTDVPVIIWLLQRRSGYTAALRSCRPEVKQLFSEVEKLLRLLLVLRVSSCEAERSFSSLRRLKTYLRSTMTQQRLNSVAVLHVHQRKLMSVSLDDILKDFISLNSQRMQTFGTMQWL